MCPKNPRTHVSNQKVLQWLTSGILQPNTGRDNWRAIWLVALIITLWEVATQPVVAEIIRVSQAQVVAGDTGFLDLSFEDSSGKFSLAGYQIELNLTGPDSGVWFTNFAEPANAIFPGQIPNQTLTRAKMPGQTAAANDFLLTGEVPIEEGMGLLRVWFATSPGSLGVYYVTVDTNILRTNFTDGLGNLVPINSFIAGSIVLVPEPSSLLLILGGLILIAMMRVKW